MSDHVSMSMQLVDPALLSKIDKLFACGVGSYVSLPQIVVVGDQSSGKSSVLQGLTKLPFPRDSGLCTRFVTQITFRRAPLSNTLISIIAAKGSSSEHAAKVEAWSRTIENLDIKTFADIMVEVHTTMGLGDQNAAGSKGTFSEDILKIDISGPDKEHFSVIDVPGIFRNTTKGLTTETDREMVRTMVRGYMENPRSVILAVIPANVDVATQEILTMAEEVDKEGSRTLGVLTKPDLVDIGAEGSVIELIDGKKYCLSLGWCIVRNPGQIQVADHEFDRDSAELSFFAGKSPWNSLDRTRVGIASLKVRLQNILANHIRREFPSVKQEIHKLLNSRKQEKEGLGAKRGTTEEQRSYLMEISMRYQEIATSALNNKCVGNDWFDQYSSLRFATKLVNRNEDFRKSMELHGHKYSFEKAKKNQNLVSSSNKLEAEDSFCVRSIEDHPDITELVFPPEKLSTSPATGILSWLETIYKNARGFELGTFDAAILATTMKQQSQAWHSIAMGHISDVVTFAHNFIEQLMKLVCPNRRALSGLMSLLIDELIQRYRKAIDHVRFLLCVERNGTPCTVDYYFAENLKKSRHERFKSELSEKSIDDCSHGKVVRWNQLVDTNAVSNEGHIVQELHDILRAYYKVALKRFVDNVCMQAGDYYFVSDSETPLKLFSPKFVSCLTTEQLEDIAGEDAALKQRRDTLIREIERLEAGKKILL